MKILSGKGPRLLELITYRWYGHVDWRELMDVGVDRSNDNIDAFKHKDPIARLYKCMLDGGLTDEESYLALNEKLDSEIAKALGEQAMAILTLKVIQHWTCIFNPRICPYELSLIK